MVLARLAHHCRSLVNLKRDLRIDVIRGAALLTIFIDHLFRNPFSSYTLRRISFVDAADVFFFLSGYVSGLVYTRVALQEGLRTCAGKSFRRCRSLYVAHIGCSAAVFAVLAWFAAEGVRFNSPQQYLILSDPLPAALYAGVLAYVPRMLCILPAYIFFMLLVPVVVDRLGQGRMGVIGVSLGLYLMPLAAPGVDLRSLPDGGLWGEFNPFSWQFVFFLGTALGSWKTRGFSLPWLRNRWLIGAAFAGLAAIAFLRMMGPHMLIPRTFGFEEFASHVPREFPFTDKRTLGPLRLVNLFFLIVAGRSLTTGLGPRVWSLLSPLVLLGQNSLAVFSIGIPLSEVITLLALDGSRGFVWWVAANAVGAALLYIVAAVAATVTQRWLRPRRRSASRSAAGGCAERLPPGESSAY
jgi:hypothetical protein